MIHNMIVLKLAVTMVLVLYIASKKVNIGIALVIGGSLIGFLSGYTPLKIVDVLLQTIQEKETIELLLAIFFITILGFSMDKLGFMNKMIVSLEKLLRSLRLTILITPAIVGTLLVTGGALMSCPMVDKLGDRLNLENDKKAAINLIFRHGLYFVYPLSPPILLALQLGDFNTWEFIKLQMPITIAMYFFGYWFFLKDLKVKKVKSINLNEYIQNIGKFLLNTAPILVSVGGVFIFNLIFYQSLIIGILTLFLIYEIKKRYIKETLEKNFIKVLISGINPGMIFAIFGIMFFKNVVGNLPALEQSLNAIIAFGIPVELIIFISAAIISYSLASTQPGVAILYPLILPMASTPEIAMLYGMFIYVSSFMFYYWSPLHMCQVLTLEYFNVSIKDLYKNYKFILPLTYGVMLVIYFYHLLI